MGSEMCIRDRASAQKKTASALGMLCGVLSVAVLAGGVVLVNNYNKMRQMESVLASVLPAGVANWDEYQKQQAEEPDFIIEELPGNVYPTGETGESYTAGPESQTMEGTYGETSKTEESNESVDFVSPSGQESEGQAPDPAYADDTEQTLSLIHI